MSGNLILETEMRTIVYGGLEALDEMGELV